MLNSNDLQGLGLSILQMGTHCSRALNPQGMFSVKTRRKSSQCPPPALLLLPGRDTVSQEIRCFHHRQFFPLVTPVSHGTTYQQALSPAAAAQLRRGEVIVQLPSDPAFRRLMLDGNRGPTGATQSWALRTRPRVGLPTRHPGLNPWS